MLGRQVIPNGKARYLIPPLRLVAAVPAAAVTQIELKILPALPGQGDINKAIVGAGGNIGFLLHNNFQSTSRCLFRVDAEAYGVIARPVCSFNSPLGVLAANLFISYNNGFACHAACAVLVFAVIYFFLCFGNKGHFIQINFHAARSSCFVVCCPKLHSVNACKPLGLAHGFKRAALPLIRQGYQKPTGSAGIELCHVIIHTVCFRVIGHNNHGNRGFNRIG